MRNFFISDWGWKLLSLFLAIAIWLTVHRILHEAYPATSAGGNPVTYGNLPVQIISPMDVRNFRVVPATVTVTVNGPAQIMDQLQAGQVHAIVELTNTFSNRDLQRPVEISTPNGVTTVNIDPPQVLVIPPPPLKNQ
jgi:YbbR domain-containing protein